jgi:hypothetical protein
MTRPAPQPEHERLPAVAGTVERLATLVGRGLVVQPAGVVHADFIAGHGDRALSRRHVDALQFGDVAASVGRRLAAGGQ